MKEIEIKFSANQVLGLKVVATIAGMFLLAVVNQRIGERRGFHKGLSNRDPMSSALLESSRTQGYNDGWYDGAWANDSESFKMGVKLGANLSRSVLQSTSLPIIHEAVPA